MKKLIVVGAGGFGREIVSWIDRVPGIGRDWVMLGFLDDNLEALKPYKYDFPIISTIKNYQPNKDDVFVMGIASPTEKKLQVAKNLKDKGAIFLTLVHPSTTFGNNVHIGTGCVICQGVIFTCDIHIGDFVTINVLSAVGHDTYIGDGSTLYSFVNINGFAKLGRGVEIGSHGSVLPNVIIEDFAKVGAGSIAIKSIKEKTTVLGVPAKKILSR